MGSLSLHQWIFPTQGSNPGLPHCGHFLYQLSHQGRPRILEWVACPFSRGSSWPRNQTRVSCIAGRFFTNWAIREAHKTLQFLLILDFRIYNHKASLRVREGKKSNAVICYWLVYFGLWLQGLLERVCDCVMQCPCIMLFNFWNQSTQSALIRRYCAVISNYMYNG